MYKRKTKAAHRLRCAAATMMFGACAVIGANVAQAQAVEQSLRTYDIGAGDLGSALNRFADQSGLQVLFDAALVKGLSAPAVQGKLAARDALSRLLKRSNLIPSYVNDSTVIIKKAADSPSSPPPPPSSEKVQRAAAEPPPAELEKVTVTGSRLLQSSVEGPQQVKIYSRADIEQSGQNTIVDFLNTLPAVSVAIGSDGAGTVNAAGTVRLRGLPLGSTLVLLDGRPVEGAGSTQSWGSTFDTNTIPAAAVERIEVVPEAASAIYGSDAIGGVVNIILRKDFDGGAVNATSGAPTEGGYRDSTASFAWGKKFERGSISIVGGYQVRGTLDSSERDLTANKDYRRFGGPDYRSSACNPGNVYAIGNSNLPGLSSSYAGIPGTGGTLTPADFSSTAGVLNLCGPSAYGGSALIAGTRRGSVLADASYALTADTQAFSQIVYSQIQQSLYSTPATISKITVPASNPFNPFGVPVAVSYRFTNEGPTDPNGVGTQYSLRVLAGLKGRWGDRWDWEAYVAQSQNHMSTISSNNINTAALTAALANSDPAQSINLFTTAVPASQSVLSKILYESPYYLSSRLQTANAFVRGSPFDLPSGPVETVLGVEYDRTRQTLISTTGGANLYSRHSYSVFGEARIPILGARDSTTGDRLAATFAARYDHYSDFGGQFTPQGGLEFRPTETLLLRASYSEAFKAPDLRAVYGKPIIYNNIELVPDPLRGGELYPTTVQFGGNADLQPQTGNSRSIGFVWSSKTIENLQVSLTNFRVEQNDRISTPSYATLFNYSDLFPGRVVRAAPTAADVAAGYAGKITYVNDTYINYGSLLVEGFDIDVDYKLDTSMGSFSPALSLTEIYKYKGAVVPGSPLKDYLDYANTDAFATRWKGTLSLGWERGLWSVHTAARYISSYLDYDLVRALGDFWTFDASARYRLGQEIAPPASPLYNAYVEVAVVNAFDRQPQYSNYANFGYDPQMADLRGRFVSLTFGTRW